MLNRNPNKLELALKFHGKQRQKWILFCAGIVKNGGIFIPGYGKGYLIRLDGFVYTTLQSHKRLGAIIGGIRGIHYIYKIEWS